MIRLAWPRYVTVEGHLARAATYSRRHRHSLPSTTTCLSPTVIRMDRATGGSDTCTQRSTEYASLFRRSRLPFPFPSHKNPANTIRSIWKKKEKQKSSLRNFVRSFQGDGLGAMSFTATHRRDNTHVPLIDGELKIDKPTGRGGGNPSTMSSCSQET